MEKYWALDYVDYYGCELRYVDLLEVYEASKLDIVDMKVVATYE